MAQQMNKRWFVFIGWNCLNSLNCNVNKVKSSVCKLLRIICFQWHLQTCCCVTRNKMVATKNLLRCCFGHPSSSPVCSCKRMNNLIVRGCYVARFCFSLLSCRIWDEHTLRLNPRRYKFNLLTDITVCTYNNN